jgi:hypothetical protein
VREQARESARRRRSAKRKRLLAAAAAVVILLVIIITVVATCGPSGAPDVYKLDLEQATAQANKAGLELVVEEQIPSFDNQPDTVLAQSPEAGLKSPDGKLRVSVSRDPIPVQINLVDDYDPNGNDKAENSAQVPNLTDGNQTTTWSTELYKSANFAGLGNKTGVGLTFSLAEGATMVQILSTTTGWTGEVLQVTSEGGATAKVADLGAQAVVTWRDPIANGRIWFTQLGYLADSGRYGVVISEIAFFK